MPISQPSGVDGKILNPPRSRELGQGLAPCPRFLLDAHAVRSRVLQLAHAEAHLLLMEEQPLRGGSPRRVRAARGRGRAGGGRSRHATNARRCGVAGPLWAWGGAGAMHDGVAKGDHGALERVRDGAREPLSLLEAAAEFVPCIP